MIQHAKQTEGVRPVNPPEAVDDPRVSPRLVFDPAVASTDLNQHQRNPRDADRRQAPRRKV